MRKSALYRPRSEIVGACVRVHVTLKRGLTRQSRLTVMCVCVRARVRACACDLEARANEAGEAHSDECVCVCARVRACVRAYVTSKRGLQR